MLSLVPFIAKYLLGKLKRPKDPILYNLCFAQLFIRMEKEKMWSNNHFNESLKKENLNFPKTIFEFIDILNLYSDK